MDPKNPASEDEELRPSPLAAALARVGDRWTLLVVNALLAGPRRFNDLLDELPGLAPNILSQRLKHLEKEALVVSSPYSRRPLRMAYQLSASGQELGSALRLLSQWGAQRSDDQDALHHASCGTPLETRWYCPTCALTLDDESEPGDLRYV